MNNRTCRRKPGDSSGPCGLTIVRAAAWPTLIESIAKRGGDRGLERSKTISDAWPATLLTYLAAKPRQLLIRIAGHERDEWPRAGRGFEHEGHRVRDDDVGMHERFGQFTRILGRIGVRPRDHHFRQLVLLPLLDAGGGGQ